jgi:hypothetical protein
VFFHASVPRALYFTLAVIVLQTPGIVNAGPHWGATFLVHLTAPTSKNTCLQSDPPSCYEIQKRGLIDTYYFGYVILSNLSPSAGVQGARFGITYDGATESGVEVSSWTSCGDYDFPWSGWPAPGGGNAVTWSSCQAPTADRMVIVGYFSVLAYGPDDLWVRPHPLDNASVLDCSGNEDVITMGITNPFGWATFSADGSSGGSSPCYLDNGSCHLSGPTVVDMGQTGIVYTMHPEEVSPTGLWTVVGNAVITSSNISEATLNATAPGTFTIFYRRLVDCVEACGCQVTVQVLGPVGVQPTTWGRIKAGLRTKF